MFVLEIHRLLDYIAQISQREAIFSHEHRVLGSKHAFTYSRSKIYLVLPSRCALQQAYLVLQLDLPSTRSHFHGG